MKHKIFFAVLFLSLGILNPSNVQVQTPDQNMMLPNRSDEDRDVRDFIAWKLVDYLRLSEEQSQNLFPLWSEYSRGRGKMQKEQRELYRKIDSSVEDSSVSTDDLMVLVNELMASERKEIENKENFRKRSREILDDRQYIKLIIFENRLLDDFLHDFNRRGNMRSP
ncbi:hypothetical protein ACFL55_00765 [Candidatus Latescibacterota bacterium]